jgi:hypothetical protein
MRRLAHLVITLSLLAVLAVPQGGCQFFSKLQTFTEIGTASISNPVTRERLQKIEAGAVLVFTGMNAWRDACDAGTINASCRDQIRTAQVYTMQIPPYLKELRGFVRKNDQVNAIVVFNQVVDLIGIVKGEAASHGVVIPTEVKTSGL